MATSERTRAVAAMMLLLAVWGVEVVSAAPESCAAVRNVYMRKGFRDNVPNQPIPGECRMNVLRLKRLEVKGTGSGFIFISASYPFGGRKNSIYSC